MEYPLQTPLQLSSHLRALRRARGLSQAALGQALGVGQTRVARIEGNPAAISVEQLIELLAALGVQLVLREIQGSQQDAPVNAAPEGGNPKRRTPSGDW